MALANLPPLSSCTHTTSIHSLRAPSWFVPGAQKRPRETGFLENPDTSHPADLVSELDNLHIEDIEALAALDSIGTNGLFSEKIPDTVDSIVPLPQLSPIDSLNQHRPDVLNSRISQKKGPFQKWMRTLHRRASHRPAALDPTGESQQWQHVVADSTDRGGLRRRLSHQKSSSGSSFGFVAAIQSASVSLASASAVTRSRRNNARSHCQSRTDRSSRASLPAPRFSEDSMLIERPAPLDAAATQRALQRRQILEELVGTEESYIRDVRFLMNVYVTILASLPTLPMRMRSSINRNLTEIVELHQGILKDLHRIIPRSDQLDHSLLAEKPTMHANGHRRWWSLDAAPGLQKGIAWLNDIPGMISDPQIAAEVAKCFSKKMNRFFIYKEYGAKYEMMIKDVASVNETMPEWETYQKGLEALALTLGSAKSNEDKTKKSLTIGDLLVKPIQRVCKYPLLFAELLKCTPVCDCPNSHMEVETALMRLREATAEINRATNDDSMKETLERTWLLQDRLVFPERKLDAASKNQIRSFGHVEVCGTLHVCWQTKDTVQGQYMICLLYRDMLCLASAGKVDQIYTIQACITLNAAKVEEVDNGRGLQCHTVPFSWKLVFESDHQLYELIMSACSSKEELEWRARLYRPPVQVQDTQDAGVYNSLYLNVKSLGTIFGKPGTIARRLSIHRATTVGPKSSMAQVILKNTSAASNRALSPNYINRSQSLLTTNTRVPVLAPSRNERIRLETLLVHIWSRDILPYPGMSPKPRNEHIVRASASTMMRKLSVAGIAGSFSKKAGINSPSIETAEPFGAVTRGDSISSESIPSCGSSIHSGNGRLAKRPRNQGVREKGGDTTPGNSQALELTKLVIDVKQIADEKIGTTVVSPSGTGSRQPSISLSSVKSEACSLGKENTCPPMSDETKKQGRRWGRAGGLRNDGTGQGLRSLFQ